MSFQDLRYGGGSSPSSAGATPQKSSSQSVAAAIFQINTAVSGFRRLVDVIGTSKDTLDHRQKLHNTRQKIVQLVKETSAKLKSLTELDHPANTHDPSKRIEDAKLARDFQSTLQEFQKVQQLASERESTYSPSAPPSSLPSTTSTSEEFAPNVEEEKQFLLMQEKRQELIFLGNEIAFNEAIIDERDQGIRDIQIEIGQANEIFKDLAVLVHEQGVVIDDIHSNVEASSATTTQSKVQLSKASKSLKYKCSWCWWLLAILAVVVVIIVVILIIL